MWPAVRLLKISTCSRVPWHQKSIRSLRILHAPLSFHLVPCLLPRPRPLSPLTRPPFPPLQPRQSPTQTPSRPGSAAAQPPPRPESPRFGSAQGSRKADHARLARKDTRTHRACCASRQRTRRLRALTDRQGRVASSLPHPATSLGPTQTGPMAPFVGVCVAVPVAGPRGLLWRWPCVVGSCASRVPSRVPKHPDQAAAYAARNRGSMLSVRAGARPCRPSTRGA